MLFALFFANETTVWIARVALATSAIHTVVEFAKNSAKSTRKVTKNSSKILLQFGNVTVSCVGYFLEFLVDYEFPGKYLNKKSEKKCNLEGGRNPMEQSNFNCMSLTIFFSFLAYCCEL